MNLVDLFKNCIPGISPPWAWHIFVYICYWLCIVNALFRIFTRVFIEGYQILFVRY